MILYIYYNAYEFTKASVFYVNKNETETMPKFCNFNKREILRLKKYICENSRKITVYYGERSLKLFHRVKITSLQQKIRNF